MLVYWYGVFKSELLFNQNMKRRTTPCIAVATSKCKLWSVNYEKDIDFFIKHTTGRHPEWREGVLLLLPAPQTEIKKHFT
jgi:hypothetical protein